MTAAPLLVRDAPVFVESETGRIAKFPAAAWARWALRAVIALPFAVLALLYDRAAGGDWTGTANGALVEQVRALPWGSSSIEVVGQLYPPITSALAAVIPGGALGLGVAGAVVAGVLLQLTIQSLQRKGFPLSVRLVFALTLALTPVWAYVATTNFEAALGLLFLGLGLLDVVRFVTYANTQAGFRAGLLFAASAFSDSTGLFAAAVAAVAGSFIIRSRTGSRLANAIVLVFPTLSLLSALAVIGIAFRFGPLFALRGPIAWEPERFETVVMFLSAPAGWLYLAPAALVIATSIALGRPGVGLAGVLMSASILLAFVLGLTPPGVAGNTYVLMLLLCVAVVPAPRGPLDRVLTCGVSALLFAIGWLDALTMPGIAEWARLIVSGGAA